jgi:ubiquinone/menaquinone biosynthesis C-methylase UbiE
MAIFDQEAAVYDQWYETELGKYVDEVETECALRLFSSPPGSRVLDVGCGTGNFSVKLAQRGHRVVGIDVSAAMLHVAAKKREAEALTVEFAHMDAHRLGFDDASFDGVLAMATLEFLANPEQALEEMFRAVKPGSPIVVGTINRDSDWGRLYKSPQFEMTVFRHARLKTPEEMRQLKPEHLVRVQECLFISPDVDVECLEGAQERKRERRQKQGKRGGFVCLLWRK